MARGVWLKALRAFLSDLTFQDETQMSKTACGKIACDKTACGKAACDRKELGKLKRGAKET